MRIRVNKPFPVGEKYWDSSFVTADNFTDTVERIKMLVMGIFCEVHTAQFRFGVLKRIGVTAKLVNDMEINSRNFVFELATRGIVEFVRTTEEDN